jgi:arylsulfatase A-like enzyme
MIESMDRSLGDLMDSIERLGVADDTIIVFMSDNGAAKHAPLNRPLRGHKLLPYEGGVRVPLIVRWPGVTQNASECADRYVIIEDLFPTFLELAGVAEPEQIGGVIDGRSCVPLLKGESAAIDYERPIFWHFPNTYDQQPYSSVRQGDWKLIYQHIGPHLELYNLADDLVESKDLAAAMPERAAALARILGDHLRDSSAAMPTDRKTSKPVPFPDEIFHE